MSNANADDAAGLRCRKCGCADMRVKRTIPLPSGRIKRYRYCRHCGTGRMTLEVGIDEVKPTPEK